MLASVAIQTQGVPSRESIDRAKTSLEEMLCVETAVPYLGLQDNLPRVQQERKKLEDALDRALSVTSSESTGRQTPTYPGRSRSSSLRRPSTPLSSHIPWPHHEPGHFGHERRPSRASFGPSEDGRGTLPLPGVPRSPAPRLPERSASLPRAFPGWQPHLSMMQQLRGSSRPPSRGATLPRQLPGQQGDWPVPGSARPMGRSQTLPPQRPGQQQPQGITQPIPRSSHPTDGSHSLPRTLPGQQQPQIDMQQLSEGSRPTERAATLPTQHPGQQQHRSSMLPVLGGPHTPRPTPVKPPRKSKKGPQADTPQAVSPPQEPQTHPAAAPTGIQTPSAGDTSSLPATLPATSDGHPAEDGAASGGDGAPSERKEPPPPPPGDGQQPPGDSPPPPPPGGKPTPPGEDPPPPERPPKKDKPAATEDTELEKKLKDLSMRMTTFSASAGPVSTAAKTDRFTHPLAENTLKEGLQLFEEAEQVTSTVSGFSPTLRKVLEQKVECLKLCMSLHGSVSPTWAANLRAKHQVLGSATRNAQDLRQRSRGRHPTGNHMGLVEHLHSLVGESMGLVEDLTLLNRGPVSSPEISTLVRELSAAASEGRVEVTLGVQFCASEFTAALEKGTGGADLLQQAINAHSRLSTLMSDAQEVSDLEKAITSKGGTISKS
ncbi:uncharacterized protein EMH_0078820 [Eimeria mitis]|uniref:Uncharacterized protein n=1 Tax=Eimeria mitis TaxID=44415 RepID=U6K5B4_9EIME|nr:uncharacterized protein EMH_0078820 [Eimeria mitis]CDJ32940.1 hypothetical protein, conserved [Eimeria mitis]